MNIDTGSLLCRAVVFTVLARLADIDVDGALDFPDADSVSDYAAKAIIWAVSAGIINGDGNGALNPPGEATRAEVAAVLRRFVEAG